MNTCHFTVAAALAGATLAYAETALPRIPPTEPAHAEETFRVQDGFRMELVASEPLVTDPVAIAYDENGLAYVVEMNDYPYTDKKSHQPWKDNTTDRPIGKVRVLEDTNGDGKYDRSHIFAENLSWPTGVAVWKGGVFVTATPDVWYLKDTDGDRKADVRRKVFTGFRKYNVQAVINNPIWGLDHKLYVAGSGNGGEITHPGRSTEKGVRLNRNDFRIDPESEAIEIIPGGARFGNTFDAWGRRFICNIRNPAQHIVFDTRYLARNPYYPLHTALHDAATPGDTLPVYRISPIEPWRELRARRWTEEKNQVPRSELVAGGVFTSASGITVYRGGVYPQAYEGQAFLGEVANNVIYRQKFAPQGVTFTAARADDRVEFVASTDIWFRPVNFANAPDGTLHVLDMYREIIEHPWSIPDDIHAEIDLESGRDRGRIYRLVPPGFRPAKTPVLGKQSTLELVRSLESGNAWIRETAHRLIFERQDKRAAKPLRKLLRGSRAPLARLHALWSLQGLAVHEEQDLLHALADEAARLREHAVKLSEPRLAESQPLYRAILSLASDPDLRVRCQVALSLGAVASPETATALAAIARSAPGDDWIRAAVCSAPPATGAQVVALLLADKGFVSASGSLKYIRELAFVLGAQPDPELRHALIAACDTVPQEGGPLQDELLRGFGDGLRQGGRNFRTAFANQDLPAAKKMESILNMAAQVARHGREGDEPRLQAVRLLAYDTFPRVKPVIEELLTPAHSQQIQIGAIRVLAGFKEGAASELLVAHWPRSTPAVREEIATALTTRKDRVALFLKELQSGSIPAAQVQGPVRSRLLAQSDPALKDAATKLFGDTASDTRKEVVAKYQSALALTGSPERGRQVYATACLACHRFNGEGNEIGPNLETVRPWEPEKILLNILDPNREVMAAFVSYEVELRDGTALVGLITGETGSSLTLKLPDNSEQVILRQNIESISSSGLSLMPEGLESSIDLQAMADLLAYLKN